MSVTNETERRAEQMFQQYFRDACRLDDLAPLAELLPLDAPVLRHLQVRCMAEVRKAVKGGNHTEVRRFSKLALQLQEQAELADPRRQKPK